jgi:Leucine-rich repeat (LRR) protein
LKTKTIHATACVNPAKHPSMEGVQDSGDVYKYTPTPPRPATGYRTKLSLKGLKKQLLPVHGAVDKNGRPATVGVNTAGQLKRTDVNIHHKKRKEKTYGAYGAPLQEKPGLAGAAEKWTKWYMSEKPGTAAGRVDKNSKKGPFPRDKPYPVVPSTAPAKAGGVEVPYSQKRDSDSASSIFGGGRPLTGTADSFDMHQRPLTGTTEVLPSTPNAYGGARPGTSGFTSANSYVFNRPLTGTTDTYNVNRPLTGTADTYDANRPLTGTADTYNANRPLTGTADSNNTYQRPLTGASDVLGVRAGTPLLYGTGGNFGPRTGTATSEYYGYEEYLQGGKTEQVYEIFDPSMKPPITPYPRRPLTKEEKKSRGKNPNQKSLEQKMGAEDPWLIDIRGTLEVPKSAARQRSRGTPDKRALMTRPGTATLPAIPHQKPLTAPPKKEIDVQALLKAARAKRPHTVQHDSRAGHAIKYTDSVDELGSHHKARETIENQAHLQIEQSIRDFEIWEKDMVDLKWAKDSVKGWGTLGTDILKNKVQRLNERMMSNAKETGGESAPTDDALFKKAFHKSLGNGGMVEMLWSNIQNVPRSFVTTLAFQVSGLKILRLTGNKLTHFEHWFPRSFPHLIELHLGSNKLNRLPENISLLTSLQELYLQHNLLTELPWEIGKLTKLEIINLTNNRLNILPNSIGKLVSLEELFLEQNNLMRVPDTIKDAINIQDLRLGFNPIATMAFVHVARLPPPPPTHEEVRLYEPIIIGVDECIGYKHVDTGEVIARLPEVPAEEELSKPLTPYQELVQERRPVWELHFDTRNGRSFYLNNLTGERDSRMPKHLDLMGNLCHLQFLSLQNVLLRDVPESIGNCVHLREIWMQNNKIELLPYSICHLHNLETLIVSNNYIHHLPKKINLMRSLTTLKIDRNRLTEIPVCFGHMSKLKRVWLSANKIEELPYTMMYLTNLTDLMLGGNPCEEPLRYLFELGGIPAYQYHLREVECRAMHGGRPPNVGLSTRGLFNEIHIPKPRFDREFKQVLKDAQDSGHLDLQWRSLTQLLPGVDTLTALTSLRMNNNLFADIPDEIAGIQTLVTLHVANNRLTRINENVCKLKKLRYLYCEDNRITELPPKITFMIRLRELRVCRNQLSRLPERIGKCLGLQVLELQLNRLTKLPASIVQCRSLKRLTLQKNYIRRLPLGFDRLTALEHLDLNQNRMKNLPLEMSNMRSLKELLLSSNRIEKLDESFSQGNLRTCLEKLHLIANRFVQLPLSFQHLSALKDLKLGWNKQLISPPFELAIDVTGELNPKVNKKIQMCSWWWTEERINNLKAALPRPRFKPGESGWSKYHEGTISKVNTDNTYDVVFDDCARAGSVRRQDLKLTSRGIVPRKAFQKDNLESGDVEVASGLGGLRAGRFDGEVQLVELDRIPTDDLPGNGVFVGDRIVAKKPKLLAPVGFGVDSVREYCKVREWRLEDFRQAMKKRNIKFAHSRLTPTANNLLIDPLILSYLNPTDVSDIDAMADGYVNGPFPAGTDSANVVQEMIDLIILRTQQFHHRVLTAFLSVIDERRAETCEEPWGANGAGIKCYMVRGPDFVGLEPEEYIAEFTQPGSVGLKFKEIPGSGGFGGLVKTTTGQAREYKEEKIQPDHRLLKIGRGENVSGEQLWADADQLNLVQIHKLIGRLKCPSKVWFRATLAFPYSQAQLTRAVDEYIGPYGKVAENLKEARYPFEGSSGPQDDSDDEDEDESEAARKKRKRKRKKKSKASPKQRTNGWVKIQTVIYSPLEARRLAKEFKYITKSLQNVEDDVEAYLKSITGKLKLLHEVRARMEKVEEIVTTIQGFYGEALRKFQKAEGKYEDVKGRVAQFESGANYNLHKFRTKELAFKKLNATKVQYEADKKIFSAADKAYQTSMELQTWSRKEWTERTKVDLFNKYKMIKKKELRLRYRRKAEKEGDRRPWDENFELWKEKRAAKKAKKAYEEAIARRDAKRRGVEYVAIDSEEEEDEWSVEEEVEATGELDHLKQKAKAALKAKFSFLTNFFEAQAKKIKEAVQKKYNSLNAYSWDEFDPKRHCQGQWDGTLKEEWEEKEEEDILEKAKEKAGAKKEM